MRIRVSAIDKSSMVTPLVVERMLAVGEAVLTRDGLLELVQAVRGGAVPLISGERNMASLPPWVAGLVLPPLPPREDRLDRLREPDRKVEIESVSNPTCRALLGAAFAWKISWSSTGMSKIYSGSINSISDIALMAASMGEVTCLVSSSQ